MRAANVEPTRPVMPWIRTRAVASRKIAIAASRAEMTDQLAHLLAGWPELLVDAESLRRQELPTQVRAIALHAHPHALAHLPESVDDRLGNRVTVRHLGEGVVEHDRRIACGERAHRAQRCVAIERDPAAQVDDAGQRHAARG